MALKLKAEPATAAKLLQRIKGLKETVEQTTKKLHRQKIELWLNTHLYIETQMTKEQWTISECYAELVQTVGGNTGFWARGRKIGRFIRDTRLDCEQVWCSSLSKVASYAVDSKHWARIKRALEAGTGPTQMDRIFCELGYRLLPIQFQAWTRKMIRRQKHEWKDWDRELQIMVGALRHTTDTKSKVQLVVRVGGKDVYSTG